MESISGKETQNYDYGEDRCYRNQQVGSLSVVLRHTVSRVQWHFRAWRVSDEVDRVDSFGLQFCDCIIDAGRLAEGSRCGRNHRRCGKRPCLPAEYPPSVSVHFPS